MKRTIKVLALTGLFAVFAAPALAQTKECTDEFKSATYQKWYDNRKEHQDVAAQAAKEYLATCTTEDQYSAALKKFVDAWDKINASADTNKQFDAAYKSKNYADQLRLGKQIIATDPENSAVYIILGLAGLGDPALLNDSSQYAKKAIEMIETGKPFAPFTTKDQPLAYLNYTIAKSLSKNSPAEAIPYYLKAAKFDSDLKKNPQLYTELAGAYGEGPIAKLSEEYKAKYTVESPESKLALANINQVIDRQIDALARAAALTTDAANKKAIMDVLTGLYKDRNKSEAGLNELIASVLSKPIPDVPTPLTSLPTPAPSTTPGTSGTSTNGAASTGTNGAAKTGGTTGASTTGQKTTGSATASGTGTAKPAASPTPSTKKPRSNHRRG
jgi:arginine utilization protein RocB